MDIRYLRRLLPRLAIGQRAVLASIAFGALALGAFSSTSCGYFEPCQILAERICGCELTDSLRTACRTERITNAGDQVEHTDEEREQCNAALDTCTCEALDNHETDKCAFMRPGGELPDDEPQDPDDLTETE